MSAADPVVPMDAVAPVGRRDAAKDWSLGFLAKVQSGVMPLSSVGNAGSSHELLFMNTLLYIPPLSG